MKSSVCLLPLLLGALPASAQSDQTAPPADATSEASKSADSFSLDLNADDAVIAPKATAPTTADTPAPAVSDSVSRYTIDTPIEQLLANPRTKAVLDRNLPGISTDKNLDKIRNLSLRALQSHSGGKLTDALLEKTGAELAAINPEKRLPPGR